MWETSVTPYCPETTSKSINTPICSTLIAPERMLPSIYRYFHANTWTIPSQIYNQQSTLHTTMSHMEFLLHYCKVWKSPWKPQGRVPECDYQRENFSTVSLVSKSFKGRSSKLHLEKHCTMCCIWSQSAQFGCQVYNFGVRSIIAVNFFPAFFATNTFQLSPHFIFWLQKRIRNWTTYKCSRSL